MKDDKKELYSDRVSAGSRTYFFDVKATKEGVKYMAINEVNSRGEHNRILIFEENIPGFQEGLENAIDFIIKK